MTATVPPADADKTHFDGREFVADDAPAGESSSPADGNDDDAEGQDAAAEGDDAPSNTDEDGEGDGEDEGSEDGDEAELAPAAQTVWDQTPEDKRAKRFNDLHAHSAEQATKLKSFEAKLAKYEAGEGPKPTEAETKAADAAKAAATVKTPDLIFSEALSAQDVTGLSENQRSIRRLHLEAIDLHEKTVKPAQEAVDKAETALSEANASLQEMDTYLKVMRKRNEGREGLYDSEISDAEESIRRLKGDVNGAKSDLSIAMQRFSRADDAHKQKVSVNRGRAADLAKQEGQKHQETASQSRYDSEYKAEEARLGKVWDSTVKTVLDELKIPDKLRKAAAAQAFFDVEAIGKKRGDANPVTEAEFKKLVTESIKADIGSFADTAAGQSEAEAADSRARATEQTGPKKRVASRAGDANRIPTVEEAENELRAELKSGIRSGRARAS